MPDLDSLPYATVREMRAQIRNEIIEECAVVAEDWGCHKDAVAAIRALKDQP